MKKLSFILILLILLSAFSSCMKNETIEATKVIENKEKKDNDLYYQAEDNQSELEVGVGQALFGEKLSLDKLIEESYTIFIGKFISVEQDEMILNQRYYCFSVVECLKGNADGEKEISVIIHDFSLPLESAGDDKSYFQEGQKYILFLSKSESIFRGDKYLLKDSFIAAIKDDKIFEIYQQGEPYSGDRLEDKATLKSKIDEILVDSKENGIPDGYSHIDSDNIQEIVEFTDIILEAVVYEEVGRSTNGDMYTYSINVNRIIKGNVEGQILICVSNKDEVKVGEEYLFMLSAQYQGGRKYTISSFDSVVSIDNIEKYEEYMNYIDK